MFKLVTGGWRKKALRCLQSPLPCCRPYSKPGRLKRKAPGSALFHCTVTLPACVFVKSVSVLSSTGPRSLRLWCVGKISVRTQSFHLLFTLGQIVTVETRLEIKDPYQLALICLTSIPTSVLRPEIAA